MLSLLVQITQKNIQYSKCHAKNAVGAAPTDVVHPFQVTLEKIVRILRDVGPRHERTEAGHWLSEKTSSRGGQRADNTLDDTEKSVERLAYLVSLKAMARHSYYIQPDHYENPTLPDRIEVDLACSCCTSSPPTHTYKAGDY